MLKYSRFSADKYSGAPDEGPMATVKVNPSNVGLGFYQYVDHD